MGEGGEEGEGADVLGEIDRISNRIFGLGSLSPEAGNACRKEGKW